MSDKSQDMIYTARDIELYLTGKLSPAEMHAIEKAALDDPFLAEAIEGYATVTNEDWNNPLADLKASIAEKGFEAKVVAMHPRKNNWWKVAAAVVVLSVAAVTSYLLMNKNNTSEQVASTPVVNNPAQPSASTENNADKKQADTSLLIAKTDVKPAPTEKNAASSVSSNAATEQTKDSKLSDEQKKSADVNTASGYINPANNDVAKADAAPANSNLKSVETFKATKETSAKNDYSNLIKSRARNTKLVQAVVDSGKSVKPLFLTNQEKDQSFAKRSDGIQKPASNWAGTVSPFPAKPNTTAESDNKVAFDKEPALNKNFSALVVGPDNSPLPFANVNIKSESFGTYADVKGNFRLISSDSILTVEVKAAGYQPKTVVLKSFVPQNKIVLAEDVAVMQYKAISAAPSALAKNKVSRRASLVKDSVINAEPADGWENYNLYVRNNIQIPDEIEENNIHGRVELSFEVAPNGTISNVKVDKSLCNNCDEAAKKLIEQGPQWKVKNGKKAKGKITVEF